MSALRRSRRRRAGLGGVVRGGRMRQRTVPNRAQSEWTTRGHGVLSRFVRCGAVLCGAGLAIALAGCGLVTVPQGPDAADPACADIVQGAPAMMLEQPRTETSSQGTVAWGRGADAVVLRCGVTPPGPTADMCTRLGSDGVEVDWIVREEDGIVHFTTYGRTPAVDVTVPRSLAPDQPSAVPLEMGRTITAIPATDYCVGPTDAG